MNSIQQEEIESLRAIYCKEGELMVKEDDAGYSVSVKFDFAALSDCQDMQSDCEAVMSFLLPMEYPEQTLPEISISCPFLSSENLSSLQQQLEERASELLGLPLILDLCFFAQEILRQKAEEFVSTQSANNNSALLQAKTVDFKWKGCDETPDTSSVIDCDYSSDVLNKLSTLNFDKRNLTTGDLSESQKRTTGKPQNEPQTVTMLLHLDHMRSKNNYIKLIKKWVSELGLTGRLIFCQKVILILLQGETQNVKEYVVRNRTVNVDVDSKGRSCKERMLTVLCEVPLIDSQRLDEFCVLELQSADHMCQLFTNLSLSSTYDEFVQALFHKAGSRSAPSSEIGRHQKK